MEDKLKINKNNSVQNFLPYDKVLDNGIIKLKNNKYIKILKINPINYNLKSDLEKEAILNSYKIFLKTCQFNIQILIQSSKEDLSKHISNIQKNISKKENQYLKEISENYIEYIYQNNLKRKSASKNFFIIIYYENNMKKDYIETEEIIKNDLKEKYFKIKESLSRCGNYVEEIIDSNEIQKLFLSFFNSIKNSQSNIIKN